MAAEHPEQEHEGGGQPPVVVVRGGRRRPIPIVVWLLLIVIIAGFVFGMWMWNSGTLRPDPADIPRPPLYVLTPQP
ncbi:MAG: hypothetical protein Kow00124_20600 [Anaerolineae bacterium]